MSIVSAFGMDPSRQILAFLQDCKENPDDETPRLVFADWLEERDDPRGTFIRVQCQREGTSPLDSRFTELQAQEQALLGAHERDWLASLQELPGTLSFQRGLLHLSISQDEALRQLRQYRGQPETLAWLEGLSLGLGSLANLLRLSPSVLAAITSLEMGVRFSRGYPVGSGAISSGWTPGEWPVCHELRHLRCLGLGGQILDLDTVTGLSRSSLDSLRVLHLGSSQLTEDSLAALVQAPWLAGLTSLNLEHNPIGDKGLRWLLPLLPGSPLRRLDLSYGSLGERSLERLAGTGLLSRLVALNLAGNDLRGPGIRSLGRLSEPGRVQSLNLSSNGLEDEDVIALASSPLLAQVRSLDLKINRIGRRGAEALAGSPYLSRLAYLDLSYNQLGNAPLALWTGTAGLPALRVLHLGNNQIDDEAFEGLARLPLRAQLRTLVLRRNGISDRGLMQLLGSPLAEQVVILDFSSNQLRPRGARLLAETAAFRRLRVLQVDNNEIGDAGALALAGSTPLQQLTRLDARGNRILGTGLGALQRKFGARVDV